MSRRLPRIPPELLDHQQRSVYERITGGPRASNPLFPIVDDDGTLHGPFGVMVFAPTLGTLLEQLGEAIRYRTELAPRLREIAILHVAQATRSEFEWWAHAKVARSAGLTSAELDALALGCFSGRDEREQVLVELCRLLLDEKNVSEQEFARISDMLGLNTIIDVVVLVGYYRLLAQLMAVFDIGPPEGGK